MGIPQPLPFPLRGQETRPAPSLSPAELGMWLRAPCGWQKVQPKGQGWPLQALRNTPGEMKHPDYKHLARCKAPGASAGACTQCQGGVFSHCLSAQTLGPCPPGSPLRAPLSPGWCPGSCGPARAGQLGTRDRLGVCRKGEDVESGILLAD